MHSETAYFAPVPPLGEFDQSTFLMSAWCRHLVNWTKQTRRLWSGPFAPLCENVTSVTKPEVRNVLHCRQKRPEPRPQVTRTENLVKFGLVISNASGQTYMQTDRHDDSNTWYTYWSEVNAREVWDTKLRWQYSASFVVLLLVKYGVVTYRKLTKHFCYTHIRKYFWHKRDWYINSFFCHQIVHSSSAIVIPKCW